MAGVTIIDVKIVGLCAKHRKESPDKDWPTHDLNGKEYSDDDISCVGCAL